ncbi:MAG: ferritin family protein [Candidatus Omnitrophica bacterium]|nr:ferritin family protein [Candidatus Omnitrophota bacterium]
MSVFNAAEIIDMGIEKEKKRRDFYGLVAEKFTEKEMKDLFTRLRDWEDEHIKKFSEIRQGVEEDDTHETYPGELADYMKVLVEDRLYKEASPSEFAKNVKTPIVAIQYGMAFERDAILFFSELLPAMGRTNRDSVQKLIDEEKQHLIYLSKLKQKFQS